MKQPRERIADNHYTADFYGAARFADQAAICIAHARASEHRDMHGQLNEESHSAENEPLSLLNDIDVFGSMFNYDINPNSEKGRLLDILKMIATRLEELERGK